MVAGQIAVVLAAAGQLTIAAPGLTYVGIDAAFDLGNGGHLDFDAGTAFYMLRFEAPADGGLRLAWARSLGGSGARTLAGISPDSSGGVSVAGTLQSDASVDLGEGERAAMNGLAPRSVFVGRFLP